MIFGNSEIPEFKLYIQVRFKLGSAINEIFKELKIVLPKGHLSLSTLTRWMDHFKRKVGDLKDNHRIGRPITETIRTKIERFWDVISL
jgi:transposase